MKKFLIFGLIASMFVAGCTTRTRVLTDEESAKMVTVTLDENDFKSAAKDMLAEMNSGKFATNNNGKPWQVYITNIKNETLQRISVKDLTDYIENSLINGGKVLTTRAVGENKSAAIAENRALANDPLFNKETLKKNGTVKGYDYTLEGRISQRDSIVSKGKKIEYKFSLDLIDMESGNKVWGNVKTITKLADEDAQTW